MEKVVTTPIDPVFDADEKLYYRLKEEDCVDDRVLNTAIRLPSCSVNRSKYSKPEDVLIPTRPEFVRIAVMGAVDLPDDYRSTGNTSSALYSFSLKHVPFEINLAHSEVQVSKDGAYKENRKFTGGVKKALKNMLAKKMTVLPF